VLLLVIIAILSYALPARVEATLPRKSFYDFPLMLEKWQGRPVRLGQIELDALKLDDYVMADFVGPEQRPVNFYVAYYASQRKGESAHSPRSCIPGGGWEITDLTQRTVDDVRVAGQPLRVNRVVIQKGDNRQLIYYWFQQRGRIITNEYLVKWYLFWDSVTRNRTDGALVRLATAIGPGVDVGQADTHLSEFAALVSSRLDAYIPN
jgi:EpsI family protein